MPKRGAVALVLTVFALVLLFSFKTPDGGLVAAGRNVALVGQAGTSSASGGSVVVAPAATAAPQAASNPAGAGDPGAATPAPATTPAPAATQAPTAAAGATRLANGTDVGPVVQTQFGPVQVQVTISGGKIAEVAALQLPSDRQRSAYISSVVGPMLRSEALTAQSAQIDLISGATYTSDAYAQSLQAALDQAAHG